MTIRREELSEDDVVLIDGSDNVLIDGSDVVLYVPGVAGFFLILSARVKDLDLMSTVKETLLEAKKKATKLFDKR